MIRAIRDLEATAGSLISIIGIMSAVLITILFFVFIYSLIKYLMFRDNTSIGDYGRGRMLMISLIGLFVVTSFWGLVVLSRELIGVSEEGVKEDFRIFDV